MRHWLPNVERRRQLLIIALPIIGGMLSQNVLNLVDIGMVSTLGDTALAATGVGSFFNYLSVAIVLGLATGVQATASRRFGEQRDDQAALPLNGGLLLAMLVGIPLSVVLIFWGGIFWPSSTTMPPWWSRAHLICRCVCWR